MIQITLVRSPAPRQTEELVLRAPEGTSVENALLTAGWLPSEAGGPNKAGAPDGVGIWGRKVDRETVLRDGDRLELYRPLRVDPKVARRERFVGQGAKAAGLFSRRRPHSKSGY